MQGLKPQRGAIIIEQTETTRPEPHRGEIIIERREIAQNKPQRGDTEINCDIHNVFNNIAPLGL